ncbi:divalent-cation tolerance protein CutA [Pseudorhodoferax sp.]|uniref:divalent-cation tolerance protein CutA n=1 Tax=Pseudorhodoferax sp. TaxID=1993553 RepID=UPI0039E30B75
MPATHAVFTTLPDLPAARALARTLVERRLAACVQLSAIESFYRWEGAVQHEPEVRLVCKTSAAGVAALQQAIVALHPYALPAVYALQLDGVHPPYAQWVADETAP